MAPDSGTIFYYVPPNDRCIYRNPDVYHLIRHLCPRLGVISTWGCCGISPQGRSRGSSLIVASRFIYLQPPFILVWIRPDSNRRPWVFCGTEHHIAREALPSELLIRIALPRFPAWTLPANRSTPCGAPMLTGSVCITRRGPDFPKSGGGRCRIRTDCLPVCNGACFRKHFPPM